MATRDWMSTMAENYRRYEFQTNWNAQQANRVSILDLEKGISDLTALVHQLFVGQIPATKVYGNCSIPGHPENACPSLQHNLIWKMNVVRGFPSYDSYFESYNPGWQSHFNYWDQKAQLRQQPPPSPTQVAPQTPNSEMSLEDIFHEDIKARLQETNVSSQDLGNQLPQLATSVSQLETQTSKELSSRIEANPNKNVIEVTLKSGKELHPVEPTPIKAKAYEKTLNNIDMQNKKIESDLIPPPSSNIYALPFLYRMPKSKEDEKKILNTLNKIKINIPLLELKALPYHLQYLYLGVSEILSTIISQGLDKEQNEMKLNEKVTLRNCKKKTKRFCDFIFLKKLFEVGKKVLSYKVRLKLILGKLSSSWLGHFEGVSIFPHGVARIKILNMGQTFKVKGHRSKPSLGGDKETTIIGIALASLQQLTH
ncbi:UNVERIFIED_CONTAM: hypothetical protein Slati_4304500 [Sesamum latifolium]|uniref:Uncharacterized protein n=1 Tax=Sesamum latifolium TaxID=2727402 RepID=A0AAW2TGE5_9LAMI